MGGLDKMAALLEADTAAALRQTAQEDEIRNLVARAHAEGVQPDSIAIDVSLYEIAMLKEFRAAACSLRDSELAHRAAADRYRAALDALNRAVAPQEGT